MTPDALADLGLGLEYGTVRLAPARPEWRAAAAALTADVAALLGATATRIEHIGSTAVTGMLAKPIVDLAVLLAPGAEPGDVIDPLESIGYTYRGDAGDGGGLVFVLDVTPWVRVAHLHAIATGDPQWDRYLAFVELLRADANARAEYEAAKRRLLAAHHGARRDYTDGKTAVVRGLLEA